MLGSHKDDVADLLSEAQKRKQGIRETGEYLDAHITGPEPLTKMEESEVSEDKKELSLRAKIRHLKGIYGQMSHENEKLVAHLENYKGQLDTEAKAAKEYKENALQKANENGLLQREVIKLKKANSELNLAIREARVG
ncbi:unnamed protein product [Protopolystoma xenopodis]|uniref:Uncharacterized protein n=1 Tax=Protopolystoma xenopodis TaxID=117903 RepID=A0A3S4ZYP6_9PLAT|nr:unnamed protein product [Protopolystoma xenopodis]